MEDTKGGHSLHTRRVAELCFNSDGQRGRCARTRLSGDGQHAISNVLRTWTWQHCVNLKLLP